MWVPVTAQGTPRTPLPLTSIIRTKSKHMAFACLHSYPSRTRHIPTLFSDEYGTFSDVHIVSRIHYPGPGSPVREGIRAIIPTIFKCLPLPYHGDFQHKNDDNTRQYTHCQVSGPMGPPTLGRKKVIPEKAKLWPNSCRFVASQIHAKLWPNCGQIHAKLWPICGEPNTCPLVVRSAAILQPMHVKRVPPI